jgi:hypothetical protein
MTCSLCKGSRKITKQAHHPDIDYAPYYEEDCPDCKEIFKGEEVIDRINRLTKGKGDESYLIEED